MSSKRTWTDLGDGLEGSPDADDRVVVRVRAEADNPMYAPIAMSRAAALALLQLLPMTKAQAEEFVRRGLPPAERRLTDEDLADMPARIMLDSVGASHRLLHEVNQLRRDRVPFQDEDT